MILDKNIAYDMSPSRKYTKLSELCVKLKKRVAVIVAVLRAVVVQAVAQPDQQVRKSMLE